MNTHAPSPTVGAAPIRILLVDDQALLRESLRIAIDREADLSVVGEAGTGIEAVARACELRPDIVLMDIRMPERDGIAATRDIVQNADLAGTRVIVLTMHELDEYVYNALRAGASGFLLKDATPPQLVDAIRAIHRGGSLLAPRVLTTVISHYLGRAAPTVTVAGLTPRETEVLTLVGRGLSNDEIADELVVSINTVKTHVSRLHMKLAARDRAQLVVAAYETRLIPSSPRT